MKVFLSVSFFLCVLMLNAQPENATVETINGKKYYVHIVEQGNTLYGIQTLYNSDTKSILQANPGLTDNLAIGQKILIPFSSSPTQEHYGTHIVLQGETLYGISKKYGCTIDQLKALNPGVETGLSIGQKLNIPIKESIDSGETIQNDVTNQSNTNYSISYSDSVVKHTVLEHETLYSIAKRYMVSTDTIQKLNHLDGVKVKKGDVLLIPVKKVDYEIIEKEIPPIQTTTITNSTAQIIKKPIYNVALILPLMLSQNEAEMNKPLKVDQVRELLPITKMSFEFYQGFVFAADSLTNAGVNLNIYVYDSKKDSATIADIFKKTEFSDMDLVVGPMYQSEVNVVSKLCLGKNIPLVLPFKVDSEVLNNNPLVYKTVPSNMTLYDGAVDYILQHHFHHNVLIVKPSSASDLAIFERCRDRYNTAIANIPGAMNSQIIEVSSGSSSGRDIDSYIKKDTINIVLVPSENIKFVAGIMTRLNSIINNNYRSTKMKIVVFGIEDWNKYEDLDVLAKNRLYNHYATYRFVDFNKGKGLDFVKAYRGRFGTDPTVFSTQGFDVGMYFLGALHLYGTEFDPFLKNYKIDQVQNDFRFNRVADGSGNENGRVTVVMYNNFELIQLNK